jgi:anti-sigma factor RsiW
VADLTDEMLMAYADGALTTLAQARVEAALRADLEARGRLEAFRATGRQLSKLYDKPMNEPVPAHLRDFVLNFPIERPAAVREPSAAAAKKRAWALGAFRKLPLKPTHIAKGVSAWLAGRISPPARWHLGAASAAMIAISASVGWLAHDNAEPSIFVSFEDGRVYASGPLHRVLEETPSGVETRIAGSRVSDAVTMRTNLTFKSKQDSWCREYEMSAQRSGRHVGVGCRDANGKWALAMNVPKDGVRKEGATQPVGKGNPPELDAFEDGITMGDVLGREREAAAMAAGWK